MIKMHSNLNSLCPQKKFFASIYLGEELDFNKICKAIDEIIEEFANNSIKISKEDVKIKHIVQAKVQQITDKENEDYYFNVDVGEYHNLNFHRIRSASFEFEPVVKVKFFVSVEIENDKYQAQVDEIEKIRKEKRKADQEFNSPENVKKRKELKDQKNKDWMNNLNKKLEDLENNTKAKENLLSKHGPNWKEILITKWTGQSKLVKP